MKAFVTGGTGFIGSHLVEALLEQGIQVTCLVRKESSLQSLSSLPLSFLEGDLKNEEVLQRGIQGQDFVFHLAGLTKAMDREEFDQVNHQGTRNLLRASLAVKGSLRRFVYFSSLAAVGPSLTAEPPKDSVDPSPINSYGESKRRAEEFLLQYTEELPITILRPPTVYGPRERGFYLIFRYIRRGWMPLAGSGDRLLSILYVKDLVRAALLVLETPKTIGKVYFISDNTLYSWSEVAHTIASALNVHPIRFIHIPILFLYLASLWEEGFSRISRRPPLLSREKVREIQERYWICDSSMAKEDFGYTPLYSLKQGVAETALWYQDQGWL
ncbi:NAD-dependent epimerase/dehydratase family protein [candidate division TA06 bacterium]|nr:NAD-dependent epimerase/dehydratase family protein [candidate division TA06 bacterium]